MDFWIKTWTVVFFFSITIFALLSVSIAIGGFFNVVSLIKKLKEELAKQKVDKNA